MTFAILDHCFTNLFFNNAFLLSFSMETKEAITKLFVTSKKLRETKFSIIRWIFGEVVFLFNIPVRQSVVMPEGY